MSDAPDMIDLFGRWFKEKFPQYHSEITQGSGGKVIILHKRDPMYVSQAKSVRNWIFTLSITGACWRRGEPEVFREVVSIADPKFFEVMEWRIKRITYENR